ncbi:MAG: glycosyltransferase family 4 protein [Flavisolibacter sp.]
MFKPGVNEPWRQVEKQKPDTTSVLGLVSFRIFPTHMGGQKGVAVFYKYLKKHLPVFLALSEDNVVVDEKGGIEKILFPNRKMARNIFRVKKISQLVARNNISVLLAEHSYSGWIAWLVSRKTGRPFVIHSHNIESRRFMQMHQWWWRIYHRYEGWIHRQAAHNFFISEEEKMMAIQQFGLKPSLCSVITYGVERKTIVSKEEARKKLGLELNKTIFLFNGTLDYQPNFDAVMELVQEIEPRLRKKLKHFNIIITGNRARRKLIEKMSSNPNVHYLGYVSEIDLYYQAADLFLNPVSNDSGIKTKLVEAIANGCAAVSTESGASGVRREICGDKLACVPDGDWNIFVEHILQCCERKATTTPESFYDYYDWEKITARAADIIRTVNR